MLALISPATFLIGSRSPSSQRLCPRSPRGPPFQWRCSSSENALQVSPSSNNETLFQAIRRAPAKPGVYRFLDSVGNVLYVGKARQLNARLRQYVSRNDDVQSGVAPSTTLSARVRLMVTEARGVDYVITDSEAAALALEATMVNELRPRFNVLLKDDRRHPYALITFSEKYPRIVISRTRKRRCVLDRLYGPFVDENRLRHILNAIHSVFPLRQRPRRLFSNRPCINYDLGRCPGVCQELISPEEYGATISKVDKLLSGRVGEILDEMRVEMKVLSDAMLYERAAEVRDHISTLERTFFLHGDVLIAQSEAASNFVEADQFVSRDVFVVACKGSIGKVILFQVRSGKVIARLIFSVSTDGPDRTRGEMLSAALGSHYAQSVHAMEIPEEVVLSETVSDMDILRSVLSEKRGKSVTVRLVGSKTNAIVDIALKNADMEVQLELQRVKDVERDVRQLEDMLKPFYSNLIGMDNTSGCNPTGPQADIALRLYRIECFDISHTSGSNAVGSMSVFIEGIPTPSEYRRYNLDETFSSQGHPDDYKSIRETLRRRFGDSSGSIVPSANLPDLVIIDGGKGQLSAAASVLVELGIRKDVALLSIAKQEEAIFVESKGTSINFDETIGRCAMSNGVRLVCRLRDEAHRFAVGAHRKRRGKQALRSGLDAVPGLGVVKRSKLLEHFNGSAEAISQASIAELQRAVGIGPALALRIFEYFRVDSTPMKKPNSQ